MMCRFFKPLAGFGRSVLQGTGIVCSASVIGYGANGIMLTVCKEVDAKLGPYIFAEPKENSAEQQQSKSVKMRPNGPV